ncbi:hypothetical protein DFO77_1041 [Marinilabilia salmonicolor]|uniref:Uncharacterized protein n=1 Tax=Marinilabilia salmonicolor TaxID=989 RepID=A0A368VDF2_9BACT|nr:hypothetical protein DFO77_1041 [Marinilabilia salmonicolor]
MSRLYYKIWADAIQRYWKHHPKQPWKLNVFLMMTWMHTLNAFIVALWLKYFDILVIPILACFIHKPQIYQNFRLA